MRRAFFILVLIALTLSARAQDAISPFHGGVRGGYLQNYHQTDAVCPTCGTYSNGTGSGYNIDLFGELPINFFRRMNYTFSVGFAERGGSFGEATANNLTILDPNNNAYVPLVRQSSYSASLKFLEFSTGVRVRPLAKYAAYLGAGVSAGIPIGRSATFEQTEKIISPQGVVYPETNSTTRTDSSGAIPGIATAFGALATIGYEISISNMITASPEISYYYPFNNVESGFRWHVASLGAGIALRWSKPVPYEPPPPPKPPAPVVQREDPNALAPRLTAVSLSSEPMHIIETTVTETFPILPYIFFDSATDGLSDRFAQITSEQAARFKESELPHRSLESYYQILNVVGSRLRLSPETRLAINGTTDADELPSFEERRELSRRRAEAVRDYFVNVWQIAPKRLEVTTSDAPENPSSTEYAEGFEENRRVELYSESDQILKPIVHERFREETASPRALPISVTASSRIGVRDWHLAIRAHGETIFERSDNGTPPATIEWRPTEGQVERLAKQMTSGDSIYCDFEAASTNGSRAKTSVAIPASKSINPFELSRLSLIVFDFDRAAIEKQNRRMISQFVAKSLYPVSTATITGSTDNLGELKHNQKLSEDRAFNVRDLVLQEKPDAKITSTKGIGPSQLLYDNHLPEGRYYCRTVRVEVETPLEAILHGQ